MGRTSLDSLIMGGLQQVHGPELVWSDHILHRNPGKAMLILWSIEVRLKFPHPDPPGSPCLTLLLPAVTLVSMMLYPILTPKAEHTLALVHLYLLRTGIRKDPHSFFQIPPPTRSLMAPPENPERTMPKPHPTSGAPEVTRQIGFLNAALPECGGQRHGRADTCQDPWGNWLTLITKYYFLNYKIGITLFTLQCLHAD